MPHPSVKSRQEAVIHQIIKSCSTTVQRPQMKSFASLVNEQGYLPLEDYLEQVKKLDPNDMSLDLSAHYLGKFPIADLLKVAKALPRLLKSLDMGVNQLGDLPTEQLVKLFNELPDLEFLNLGANYLTTLSPKEAFTIDNLNFSADMFEATTANELIRLGFLTLNPRLKGFDANYLLTRALAILATHREQLTNKTRAVEDLFQILQALPKHLKSLDLHNNGLGNLSAKGLCRVLSALHPDLEDLELHSNGLNKYQPDDLQQILHVLPHFLRSLGLGNNSLRDFSPEDIVKIIYAIPRDLESLDLHNNNLGAYSIVTLIRIVKSLPQCLLSLNMRCNNLNRLTVLELVTLVQQLPRTLLSLDLRLNDLDQLNINGWTTLFRSLPAELTTLHLSWSDLSGLSLDELLAVFKACPAHLTTLTFDNQPVDVQQCKQALLAHKIDRQLAELNAIKNNVSELVIGSARQGEIQRLTGLRNIFSPQVTINDLAQDKETQSIRLQEWYRQNKAYFKAEKTSTERFFSAGPNRPSGKVVADIFSYLEIGNQKLESASTRTIK